MVIRHNLDAMYISNRLRGIEKSLGVSIARLSSGYRINSAADDPAGFAMSERMRTQINSLNQAERNTQDGISLAQTAESGMSEIGNILQRMSTLATESANGTYQNETDRTNLQKEFAGLKKEIDRISSSTNFNGIPLLDGSQASGSSSASGVGAVLELSGAAKAAGAHGLTAATAGVFTTEPIAAAVSSAAGTGISFSVFYEDENGTGKTAAVLLTVGSGNLNLVAADGTKYAVAVPSGPATVADVSNALLGELQKSDLKDSFSMTNAGNQIQFTASVKGTGGAKVINVTSASIAAVSRVVTPQSQHITGTYGTDAFETIHAADLPVWNGGNTVPSIFTLNGSSFAFISSTADPAMLDCAVNYVVTASTSPDAAAVAKMSALINQKTGLSTSVGSTPTDIDCKAGVHSVSSRGITLQTGVDSTKDQCETLFISGMSCAALGISGVSIATQADAQSAMGSIKSAINQVTSARAGIGAEINMLEYTAENLSTMSENLASAESRIRDLDFSEEYVEYTKNLILSQVATAMLAQANTRRKNIVSLLLKD